MYASLLGISGAFYLGVFEQPASKAFFSTLLVGPAFLCTMPRNTPENIQ